MKNSVAIVDDRPFFERAVRYGLEYGILGREHLSRMEADAPKGIVQIADHFGTAYLRTDLETALARMATSRGPSDDGLCIQDAQIRHASPAKAPSRRKPCDSATQDRDIGVLDACGRREQPGGVGGSQGMSAIDVWTDKRGGDVHPLIAPKLASRSQQGRRASEQELTTG